MHRYPAQDIAAIYRVIAERRDMRHFLPEPIDPTVLGRLLEAAHQASSVGFMQPWRVVRVTDPALRREIHGLVGVGALSHGRKDYQLLNLLCGVAYRHSSLANLICTLSKCNQE